MSVAKIKSTLSFRELFQELYFSYYCDAGNSHCPFHTDNNSSFQVNDQFGFCHAGCTPNGKSKNWDVISLFQKRFDVSFKIAVARLGERIGIKPEKKGTVECTYDYTDLSGAVVHRTVRYRDPKSFSQQRPDGDGGWHNNLDGVQVVPYHLPRLVDAQDIWICEGEKDVHSMEQLGFVATTSPMGATKWHVICPNGSPPEVFRGKTCYIVPDNDSSGRKHAPQIAQSLHGFASTVKIVELPGLSPGGDATDFIGIHGPDDARRMLIELARVAPLFAPPEVDSASKTARPDKFQILTELLKQTNIEYFHDQFQSAWASVEISGHIENVKIKSGRFRNFLNRMFYNETQQGVGREILQQIQDWCTAQALFDGEQHELSYRAAWQGDSILIDMGDSSWRAIEISRAGWKIVQPQKPPFRRFSHTKPLAEPEPGGSIADVSRFLPIENDVSRTLIQCWLPTAFIPDIPRPGLILAGLQGSGKTFASERIRELIDPSATLTQSLPRDCAELVQSIDHNYLPVFDNLTSIPGWASDMLCRAVTGGGYSKRELYSDDDDVCYSFMRPFILNGISNSANRPDLLDRILLIELARIPETERKSLRQLLSEFNRLQPMILGAMLDALSAAMRIRDTIELTTHHRLADWQEWACAVAEVSGIGQSKFQDALLQSIDRQHTEITQTDPVAVTVLRFMADRDKWSGPPGELYKELSEVAAEVQLDREKAWPRAANSFSRRLKSLAHNLAAMGLSVEDIRITKGSRQILLEKIPTPQANMVPDQLSLPSLPSLSQNTNNLSSGGSVTDRPNEPSLTATQPPLDSTLESFQNDSSDGSDGSPGTIYGSEEQSCLYCMRLSACPDTPGPDSPGCEDFSPIDLSDDVQQTIPDHRR